MLMLVKRLREIRNVAINKCLLEEKAIREKESKEKQQKIRQAEEMIVQLSKKINAQVPVAFKKIILSLEEAAGKKEYEKIVFLHEFYDSGTAWVAKEPNKDIEELYDPLSLATEAIECKNKFLSEELNKLLSEKIIAAIKICLITDKVLHLLKKEGFKVKKEIYGDWCGFGSDRRWRDAMALHISW